MGGSACGQMPGKGHTYKSISEGHAEDFELQPKSNVESLKSLSTGTIGAI